MIISRQAYALLIALLVSFGGALPSFGAGGAEAQSVGKWLDVRPSPGQTALPPIQGLSWLTRALPVKAALRNGRIIGLTSIEGRFSRTRWSLLINRRRVQLSPSGRFRVQLLVAKSGALYTIEAISPQGEVETQRFRAEFPGYKQWLAEQAPSNRKYALGASLGYSLLSYKETLFSDLNQTAVTAKISYLYFWKPPHWDIGVSAFGTALPLSSNQAAVSARFLGLNARVGFAIPSIREPWRLSLMTGLYFTTTFASNNTFGFKNLMGPQFFPVLRRAFRTGDSFAAYGKFSPVANGFSIESLGNREIAAGLSWSHRLSPRNSLTISFDYSDLHLLIERVDISIRSMTLGAGVSW